MQQQILVPLDGSTLAESILPHAGALARATSSTLKLLQVKPPPLMDMGGNGMTSILENWQKQALDAARAYLTGVADRLQSAGLVVQTEVLEGDQATCIVSSAEQDRDLLLIAMTTHGGGGMRRWVFGSVASKVLHTCPRPLLLKRPSKDKLPLPGEVTYHTIVVPLDGSPFAEGVLEQAQRFASAVGAMLLLVSVVPPPDSTAPSTSVGTSGGAVAGDLQSQIRAAHRAEVESRRRYLYT
jgi:nucleotide-binding universal stress UspA family protein